MNVRCSRPASVLLLATSACVNPAAGPLVEPPPASDGGIYVVPDAGRPPTPPPDRCLGIRCSGHGICRAATGAPVCACDPGYAARGLECVSSDTDGDGLSDADELLAARELAPRLLFDESESLSGRTSYWAARPTSDGGVTVFYALAYYEDGGMMLGYTAHLGDSEFIVAYRGPRAVDSTARIYYYFSAHYRANTDASAWYAAQELDLDASEPGTHPIVWVALNKHANYPSRELCETSAYGTDACSEGALENVEVAPDRNLGQSWSPAFETVTRDRALNANREWFWADVRFCGWRVPEETNTARAGCAPIENTYFRQLRVWEDGTLGS